jgi:RNA polymerase sigma factor (sigma-70 family)
MFAEPKYPTPEVSRHDAEAKLIECRNKFLGFLRKRLKSPQDAEDVFQDFCVKVLRNHNSIKNGARLDAWLGITLRHTLTDHYRCQSTRNQGQKAYAIEVKILEPAAEGDVDENAFRWVSSAIRSLEPAQAELLSRLDLWDEPRDAIAADLGVNLNALGVRVHRSRVALKKKISEFCLECGEGRFMQCDCDRSLEIGAISIRSPAELVD